jgi:hypothetical protein
MTYLGRHNLFLGDTQMTFLGGVTHDLFGGEMTFVGRKAHSPREARGKNGIESYRNLLRDDWETSFLRGCQSGQDPPD